MREMQTPESDMCKCVEVRMPNKRSNEEKEEEKNNNKNNINNNKNKSIQS